MLAGVVVSGEGAAAMNVPATLTQLPHRLSLFAIHTLMQLYCILFGLEADGADEGFYSLRGLSSESSLPAETLIVFEALQDAQVWTRGCGTA